MKIQNLIHHKISNAIKKFQMFSRQEKILVALSGGKDSISLAHSLKNLNYKIECVFIDLGIPGISAKSLKISQDFTKIFQIPLTIVSSKSIEAITMPEIAEKYPERSCAACGSIKRKILNDFALKNSFDVLTTGHHLEDEAVGLFANNLRWDFSYLKKSVPLLKEKEAFIKRAKPLCFCHEEEIREYSQSLNIEIMGDTCPYSDEGTRKKYRAVLDCIEKFFPRFTEEYYKNFLNHYEFLNQFEEKNLKLNPCEECGDLTVSKVCRVCLIKKGLWKR